MTILGFTVISGSDTPCDKCLEHIGEYYENANDLPEVPFHPNCKCHYEADSEKSSELEELKQVYEELKQKNLTIEENKTIVEISKDEIMKLDDDMRKVFSYLNDDTTLNWDLMSSDFFDSFFEFEDTFDKIQTVYFITDEYLHTLSNNVLGGDNVYHSLANARAAQKSAGGEDMVEIWSNLREAWDLSEALEEQKDKIISLKDTIKDLYNNSQGRKLGSSNRGNPLSYINLLKKTTDQKIKDKFITKKSGKLIKQIEEDKKNIKKVLSRRVPFIE